MEIQFVHHEPARTYDKVCRVDHMLYLAGEDSKDTATQEVKGKDVAEQTEILFQNLKNTLEGFGSGLDYIIKMTAYLVDRLRKPHAVKYACHTCSEAKERRRLGLDPG